MTPPDILDVVELRAEARERRRTFANSAESRFVRTMKTVMKDYLQARAEGLSRADGLKGIEAVVREVWPMRPTRFGPTCAACDDTGWRLLACTHAARCGRRQCSDREESYAHDMVTPCACRTRE